MGMFDRVWFTCPTCLTKLEVQTKRGERLLYDYDPRALPVVIAADIRGETVWCGCCSKTWSVKVHMPLTVSATLVSYAPLPDDEDEDN